MKRRDGQSQSYTSLLLLWVLPVVLIFCQGCKSVAIRGFYESYKASWNVEAEVDHESHQYTPDNSYQEWEEYNEDSSADLEFD